MTTEQILKELKLSKKEDLIGKRFELTNRYRIGDKIIEIAPPSISFIIKFVEERVRPFIEHEDGTFNNEHRTLVVGETNGGWFGIYLGLTDRVIDCEG